MISGDGSQLHRLLYRSRSCIAGSDSSVEAEVAEILAVSERNNERDGLTGALMFSSSMFMQALEGRRELIEQTFERICCDLRHSEIEILEFAPAEERAFGKWGLYRVRADAAIEGLFLQLGEADGGPIRAADAATTAVTLMSALIRAHPPSTKAA